MSRLLAPAKLNLALVVGPKRAGGKHEVATVLQRITLADTLTLEPAPELEVEGFPEDKLVTSALESFSNRTGAMPAWRVTIEKNIPVAAGLGGGSSDAAAALKLANAELDEPLTGRDLHEIAAELGADVPFFLTSGPQLGEGDGTLLTLLELPQDYWIVVVLPTGENKDSTANVYKAFDRREGGAGFEERKAALVDALARGDLAALPLNDLATSPLAEELVRLGAFRADVTGAGPAVYGLFSEESEAVTAQGSLAARGEVWIAGPAW